MDRFGYRDALHAVYASSAVLGGSAAACQRLPQLKLGSELVVTIIIIIIIIIINERQYISTTGSRACNT